MKQLVRQIEMAPTFHLVAGDQHRVQLRQAACRAGDPPVRVDHENEDAELAFHDVRKARRRHVAEAELRSEPFPGRMASSKLERRTSPSVRRMSGVSRPTWGTSVRYAAIQRPALRSQASSCCTSTPD